MEINVPTVKAEVEKVFAIYEKALVTNDIDTLNQLFWQTENTIRFGGSENLYGFAEIDAFRLNRPSQGLQRTLSQTVITTFGHDFATASTLFHRENSMDKIGRQMQTWVRFYDGWKVVAAHISFI